MFRTRERTPSELLSRQSSVVLLFTYMSGTREATDKLHNLTTTLTLWSWNWAFK